SPNFLWDKTAYALGRTAGEGKRTEQEHAAFRMRHAEWLEGTEDAGLRAFLAFLDFWDPAGQMPQGWDDDLLDANVAFALESERLAGIRLHDRDAARAAWSATQASGAEGSLCLVTGRRAPAARLHPSVKGVWGAQSSGASLVSFNLDAFTSYGHAQGDNAPVSEAAAFAYGTVLNRFLATDSGHRIQIGDASTVFWADASDMAVAKVAEIGFAAFFGAAPTAESDDAEQTKKVADKLEHIRQGKPLREIDPVLADGVRFHVLGLAPNAARLSVRFHLEDTFGAITENYQRFLSDTAIEPAPHGPVVLWRLLAELAVQGKRENVPPGLAGDWMRAILSGGRYPQALLAAALMRVRSDQSVNGLRAGILRAMLTRNQGEEVPVAREIDNEHDAYQLGRLFAVMEAAQYAALGRVNASIGDRYYASASSTPARVFAPLLRGLRVHIADARKRGQGGWIEPRVAEIVARLPPDLPTSLRAVDQGRFAIGYYHEKSHRPAKAAAEKTPE
ncbi:type I-C CRISPR-associated protein Cas8c/Csd1, partial [Jannaschia sp.]|nr:type I-C CRISPR-associated protein Cas8c/Csd1 [Jannaschia sp.]